MAHMDDLMDAEDRFDYLAKAVMGLEDVENSDARRQTVENHIATVRKSFDYAYDDPTIESISAAQDIANLFRSYVQTMGISVMRLVNKDLQRGRADKSEKLARIDALTQSGNRLAFSEQLTALLEEHEKDSETYTGVILFDLDRFKGLNDEHGHVVGDIGLQTFADKLKSLTRQDDNHNNNIEQRDEHDNDVIDTVYAPSFDDGEASNSQSEYRFGGDEFALTIKIHAKNREEAEKKLNHISQRIEQNLAVMSLEHDNKTFPLVSSMGMHILETGDTAQIACDKADQALFIHKESKTERYAHCVEQLKLANVNNLVAVSDPRAQEQQMLNQAKIGETIENLIEAGNMTVHVPAGTEPDSLKVLESAGVTIIYDEPDEPSAGDENSLP